MVTEEKTRTRSDTQPRSAVRGAPVGHSTQQGRILQLDVLRGVAVLMVIGHHAIIPPESAGLFKPFAALLVRFGWTGVELFFVLSGFLIGGLLFKELQTIGRLDVPRFLIRRGFKIWPSYFVYLAFLALYLLYRSKGQIALVAHQLLPSVLQVQNYFWSARGHLWSLAVEEHFYLALPLLLLVLTRNRSVTKGIPAIPTVALVLVVLCLGLRLLNIHHPYNSATHYNRTHLKIDSLFWGVLLAYLYHYRPQILLPATRHPAATIALGGLLLSPMLFLDFSHPFVWTVGYTLLYIGYGCILIASVQTPMSRKCQLNPFFSTSAGVVMGILSFVGYYSYAIYLWHLDLGRYRLENLLQRGFLRSSSPTLRWGICMAMYVFLAVAGGVIAARLVERPALSLRDKLFPARARIVDVKGARA